MPNKALGWTQKFSSAKHDEALSGSNGSKKIGYFIFTEIDS